MPLALALAFSQPSWALFDDRLGIFFNEIATWDSNVFRMSDATAQRSLGTTSLSDRILTHQVGVTLDLPYSLQRFQATYQHFWTRYHKFDQLDFDGDIFHAGWLWAITREFTGEVAYRQYEGLASFATFRGTERDVVTTRQANANGSWLMTPRWLAYGGIVATERKHELAERRIHDIEAVSTEARLQYLTPKENRIGGSLRYERGKAPESRIFQGIAFDNGYEQVGVGVVARWDITAHSRLDGRVDYVKREYDQFSQRDYSGPAWGVTWTWTPTAKFSMPTTIRRDIAPLDDVQTSFVMVTGIGAKPRWQMTEKFALVGSIDYGRWKYRGDPVIGGDFEHRVRSGLVGFVWTPAQRIAVTGSLQREIRKSDLPDGDYKATVATIDARIGF